MGWAVDDEHTFSALLEKRLANLIPGTQFTVINAGMNGAGPLQEITILQDYVLPLKPDLIIWQIYPENDISNAYESATGKPLPAYNEIWYENFLILKQQNIWRYRMELHLNQHYALYRTLIDAVPNTRHPFLQIINACRLFPPNHTLEFPPNQDRPFALETDIRDYYPN